LRRFKGFWAGLAAAAALAAGVATDVAHAQPAALGLAADPALVRWDPAIRYGQLPNGLRYAVQRNGTPRGAVSLRLAFAVGSYDEADEERGAAHLIEHLAYAGTRSFPPHQLDLIFAPLHVPFGPDRNATSDLKQSVYQLDLPSTDASGMDVATKWLRDVAEGLTFTEPVLARERTVIESERVARANILRVLRDRMDAFEDGALRSNARYPLGTKDTIAAMTPARLQGFYDRWYRPENAAVTVVGDLPLDVLEQKVRATFGDWAPRGPAGTRASRTPPSVQRGLELQVETNPGLPAVSGICRVTPADPDGTPEARLHALLMRGLWEAILQERIAVVKSRRDVPFQEATISDEIRPDSVKTCVGIVPVAGQEVRAIAIIQNELRRFAAEGPSDEETDAGLEQVRASVRGSIGGGLYASPDRATNILERAVDRLPQLAPREGLRAFDVLMEDTGPAAVRAAFARDWGGWGPLVVMTAPTPIGEAAVRAAMTDDKPAVAP
jgi:zinc protease